MMSLFLPYMYGFSSRAKSKVHKISFFLLIVIPIYLNIFFVSGGNVNNLAFVIAFTMMYLVYEIGYIYNDVFTAAKEKKPTQWLTTEKLSFVKNNYMILISSRILMVLILSIILHCIHSKNNNIFIGLLVLLYFDFSMHNFFRGWMNVITDGILQILKYGSTMVLFLTGQELLRAFIFIYVEIALVRTVEFGIGKGYMLKALRKVDTDTLRVIYYTVISLIAIGISFFNSKCVPLLFGTIYFWGFRLLCKILNCNKKIEENRKLNGNVN